MLTEHELSTDMSINHYFLVTPVVSLGEHYKLKWVTQTIGLKISKCSALAQFCCTQPIGFVNTQHFGLVHFLISKEPNLGTRNTMPLCTAARKQLKVGKKWKTCTRQLHTWPLKSSWQTRLCII